MDREIALSLRGVAKNERLNPAHLTTLIKLVSNGKAFEADGQFPFLHNIRRFGFDRRTHRPSLLWFIHLDPTTRERIASVGEWGLGSISGREAGLYGFKSSTEFVAAMHSLEFQLIAIQRRIIMLGLAKSIDSGYSSFRSKWYRLPFGMDGNVYRS